MRVKFLLVMTQKENLILMIGCLKDRRKVDDFILYGICAADQAVKDAGWTTR